MGNPDLVIVINDMAFIVKGTGRANRSEAIQQAIKRFDEYMAEVDKNRYDPETHELYEAADADWYPEDAQTIRVYEVHG